MGLLSDPSIEESLVGRKLLKHSSVLSTLLYVGGIVWFLSLAHNSMNHGTYFSENALLPGLVQGEFLGEAKSARYLQELMKESEKHQSSMPESWLVGKMTQLGLDVYTHNFTLHHPLNKDKSYSGTNVYGILRALRSSSTESIVISAPYRPPTSIHPTNAPAIALMLALADFFANQVYWSKDVVFLVTDHEQLGAEAWLRAYHGEENNHVLDVGEMRGRGGAIQACVNLELTGSIMSHVDVRYEGLNGQLPNLDLVNLIHRLCHRESVRHTTAGRRDHSRPESRAGWVHQLKTLATTTATMATGVPNGNHGLFLRYGIAAVTLTGEKTVRTNARSSSLLQLGRVMEGVCRSLNNLMETFHQSFFFYLLPATDRYISIGVYMPAFGALGSSIVLCALALWVSTGAHETPLALVEGKQGDSQVSAHGSHWLVSTLPLLLSYHLLGVLIIRAIPHIVGLAPHLEVMELDADEALVLGLAAFCVASLCVPSCFNRSLLVPPCWQLLKCVLCLELSVLLFSGAVYNIALATIVTAVYAPVLLLLKPRESRLMGWVQRALLLLIHPLSLAALAVCLDTKLNFPSSSFLDLVDKTGGAFKRAVMFSVLDSAIYANWLFHAACLALLPNWCVMWHVSFLQAYKEKPTKVKTN